MEVLRKKFNRKSSPMLYARDTETGNIIGLPGDRTPGIDWYNEEEHKNHLICLCCNAPVHFNKGGEARNGSREEGLQPHFKINPRSNHEDGCELAVTSYRNETITEGFRLNFNTSTSDYYREKDSEIPENLEGISLKSMQDQADFMRLNPVDRIVRSWSVFREYESRWPNYMLSDRDPACQRNLIDTISMMAKSKTKAQLCSLELRVDKDNIKPVFRWPSKTLVPGKSVFANEGDKNGIKHIILPRYSFDRMDMDEETHDQIREALSRSGTYIAQGLGELSISKRGDAKFYFFEVRIITPDQIIKESLANLLKQNMKHHYSKPSSVRQPG